MSKITILFGAGAEGKGQFGLPSGEGFKRDVILAKDVAPFANLFLQEAESGIRLKNGTIISHNSSSILYQTIAEGLETAPNVLEKLFSEQADRDIAKQYLQYKRVKDEAESEDISKKFTELYRKNFYSALKNSEVDIEEGPIGYFLKNAGIYSFLDSLFNYLREPRKYKNECARVIKVYYAALLSILNGMAECIDKNKHSDKMEKFAELKEGKCVNGDPKKVIADIIDGFQNAIVENFQIMTEEEKSKRYYYNIKKLTEMHDISCVTTNYTNIGEKITDLSDGKFIYLHGKLGQFEELETKRILDIRDTDLKKTIFPFLLVQSGVKPIISPIQIREFYKACTMILNADYVLIIGYGVNSDDEHIANILRARLEEKKKIKYFVYCDARDSYEWQEKTNKIKALLQHNDLLEFYHTSEFKDVALNLK